MTLVIGTDEAGYGPNLGPLTVAATAWRVAARPEESELALMAAVTAATHERLWGDSKSIYRGGAGFDSLERGVLVALGLAGEPTPGDWPSLAAALAIPPAEPPPEQAWLQELAVPQRPHQPACGSVAAAIHGPLASHGVRLVAVRLRMVQPAEFNRLLAGGLNKSDILSQVTLDLAASLAATALPGESVVIWCDRHGGRRRYAGQVSRAFAVPLVTPLSETAARSSYAFGSDHAIEFSVGGEARTPVAMASMTAKYVRELAMLAFNGFWADRQPGLAATAGYPVDAARWRRDATAAVERQGIGWDAIWRRA